MEFEWDINKEANNIKKHGLTFTIAAKLLMHWRYEVRSDRQGEVRYLATSELEGRIISVVYTRRGDKYRIISARKASKNEKAAYRKHCDLSHA